MWNHSAVLNRLKELLTEKTYEIVSVEKEFGKHYKPDLVCKRNDKVVVYEVETVRGNITHRVIFSAIAGVDQLVFIFSNKDGKGKKRVQFAEDIVDMIKKHVGLTTVPNVKCFWIQEPEDLESHLASIDRRGRKRLTGKKGEDLSDDEVFEELAQQDLEDAYLLLYD